MKYEDIPDQKKLQFIDELTIPELQHIVKFSGKDFEREFMKHWKKHLEEKELWNEK